ncbi:hypothetical protein AWB68_08131 [Caballeronia choica]|jgi:hypothetical protein|uniref:Uncharacterized protein n=1 Tax=Caballeronia choica TaxID=326476 RepID=A0A158L014_9BURK|nr:hypothetical protein AWB68_08131 [Caballeronia choica]
MRGEFDAELVDLVDMGDMGAHCRRGSRQFTLGSAAESFLRLMHRFDATATMCHWSICSFPRHMRFRN